MKENICTSCGASISEGVQVCGECLKKSEGPSFHHAVRTLERYCKDFSSKHKSCDECPLRHHCQNTISSWPKLMLITDMADYVEPPVRTKEAVERLRKSTNKWLSKNCTKVYIAIFVLLSLIIFFLGFKVGDLCSDFKHRAESEQVVVNEVETALRVAPYWYIET